MIFGFTGTEHGMAPRQKKTVRQLLYNCTVLHLGDCVGADREAFVIAADTGIFRIGHPPSNGRKRAYLRYEEERPAKPYLDRNLDIAQEGVDGLIAAPDSWVEVVRDGTWTTVRRARSLGRKIWIVRPDGSVVVENDGSVVVEDGNEPSHGLF